MKNEMFFYFLNFVSRNFLNKFIWLRPVLLGKRQFQNRFFWMLVALVTSLVQPIRIWMQLSNLVVLVWSLPWKFSTEELPAESIKNCWEKVRYCIENTSKVTLFLASLALKNSNAKIVFQLKFVELTFTS